METHEILGRSLMDVTKFAKDAYQKSDMVLGSRQVDRQATPGSVQGFQSVGDNFREVDLWDYQHTFVSFATDWELKNSILTGSGRNMRPVVDASPSLFGAFPVVAHHGRVMAERVVAPTEWIQQFVARRGWKWPAEMLDELLTEEHTPAFVTDLHPPEGYTPLENGNVHYLTVVTNPVGRIKRRLGSSLRDQSLEASHPDLVLGVGLLVVKAGVHLAGKMIRSIIVRSQKRAAASTAQELEDVAAARARWRRGEVEGVEVIKGGLDPAAKTALDQLRETMPRVMARILNGSTKMIRPTNIRDLHRIMKEEGFTLFKVDKFGPEGGFQMFYRKGNIVARLKTKGNAGGVRVGEPHVSFSLTDGGALHWENDIAKISAAGKVRPKMIVEEVVPTSNMGARPFWYVEQQGVTKQALDAWGSATHFPAPSSFNWDGLHEIMGALAPK